MKSNRNIWPGLTAIEGIDGSGTTTLTRELGKALAARGIKHETGFEPTDGEIGQLIRKSLAGQPALCPETLALLFAADRREHLYGINGIKTILQSKRLYITDRYLFSSLAYQSQASDWQWVNRLNMEYPLPKTLIYLSIPVKTAMDRLTTRTTKDIYETADFLARVLNAYENSINHYAESGMEVLKLDARRPPEELLAEALKVLGPL